ncbi:hypothetical protein [Schleiferia thermophila]|uniref:hypothetical protein n=1 Tax=Schleiferia thermophila TaxID=884107 RepID=UPI00163A7F4C|nr:hypothetical protein [Schleiferia thermophila]
MEEGRVKEITQDKWFIGFRNIARSTDERTAIISLVPESAVGNSMPLIFLEKSSISKYVFASILTSLIFDYCTRQKLGGVNMTFGYVQQLPVLSPLQLKFSERQILCKALELSYTSWDIKAFADDVWREAGESEKVEVKSERFGELSALQAAIVQQWEENRAATGGHAWAPPEWHEDYGRSPDEVEGCPLPPFKWDEERRAVLKAELDALYARLYGLTTEELRYILDPQDVYGPDFPGETFRVLKEKEIRQFGEYRTKRLVLEAWDKLQEQSAQ